MLTRMLAAVPIALLLAVIGVAPVRGATFTVNETEDKPDGNPGNGKCNAQGLFSRCTVRAAIMEANALPGTDTIVMPGGTYVLTIPPGSDDEATGNLDILSNVVIVASSGRPTIRGATGFTDRILSIGPSLVSAPGPTVTINDAIIQGGDVRNQTPRSGGGIRIGGLSTVTLVGVDVVGNKAETGAGIMVEATGGRLTVRGGSRITDNTSTFGGSAVRSLGLVTIEGGSELSSNTGSSTLRFEGNGIATGGLTVTQARIRDNVGDGIAHFGRATITDTTISGNSAFNVVVLQGTMTLERVTVSGGGQGGISNTAALTVVNSTISGNTGTQGAGIRNNGQATILSSTITQNVATVAGGGIVAAVAAGGQNSVLLRNSIVAENSAPDGPDCKTSQLSLQTPEPVTSGGFNLIGSTSNCVLDGDLTGNLVGVAPVLGALADNGGPTRTHHPFAASPAADAGAPPGDAARACPAVDQRKSPRPVDIDIDGTARCDIGAVEMAGRPPTGFAIVDPSEAVVAPGERLTYRFGWTVPEAAGGWRNLKTLELRVRDGDEAVFHLRFDEAANTLAVARKNGAFGAGVAPGRSGRLQSPLATLFARTTVVDGPPGLTVTLKLALRFKPRLAGRRFDVEVRAEEDDGTVQGLEPAGTLELTSQRGRRDDG